MWLRSNRARKHIILGLWQFRNCSRVFSSRGICIFSILLVRLDLLDILERGERLVDFLFFEYLGGFITKFNFRTNTSKNAKEARLLSVCFHPFVHFPCRSWTGVLWRDQNALPTRSRDHQLPTSSLGCDGTKVDLAFRHDGGADSPTGWWCRMRLGRKPS